MSRARSAVLLVGGLGTRMHPLTSTRPKHLLPVGGVPLLDLQLDRLAELGVRRVTLATAMHADLIAAHVHRQERSHGLTVTVSDEGTPPLGTGGGLLAALDVLDADPDEPVVVVNGDLLTGHDLAAQVDRCTPDVDVVLHVRAAADPAPFGTVDVGADGTTVTGFREKVPGPPGTLVNAGTYVLRPRVLAGQPTASSSWERDLLPDLIGLGAHVIAHREDAWFADIGSPAALVAATRAAWDGTAGSALPRGYDATRSHDPTTTTATGARLVGGSTGRDVHVGEGAEVVDSILLDEVVVEHGAIVRESVLGAGAVVGAGARLEGCAVADRAHVAPGTRCRGGTIDPGETPADEGRT